MIATLPRARVGKSFSSSLNRVIHKFIAKPRPGRRCARNWMASGFIFGACKSDYAPWIGGFVAVLGRLNAIISLFSGRITEGE